MMVGVAATAAPAPAAKVAGGQNVFVYGSLMADDVLRILLKRLPQSSPALLPHFHRFSIKGRVYPAILPVENKNVFGQVLLDVSDAELAVLDAYEDVEYERQIVEITLPEWKKVHMSDFLKMSKDFVEELEQPNSHFRIEVFFGERRYGQ